MNQRYFKQLTFYYIVFIDVLYAVVPMVMFRANDFGIKNTKYPNSIHLRINPKHEDKAYYQQSKSQSKILLKVLVLHGDLEEDEPQPKELLEPKTVEEEVVKYPLYRRRETPQNINCDNFSDYALNCTMRAAVMYNSDKKSPPMPTKIDDWCKAVKYLTNCAVEWNLDCRDMTDSHFNEESINGHTYVVRNICDDIKFVEKYVEVMTCVEGISTLWEICYTQFKTLVDGFKKNTTNEWTHYETHFYLCCGRAAFRRCTLDILFSHPAHCSQDQALTLQKFSVIVSEGDVYQDCDFNMVYANCPGGDPRPQVKKTDSMFSEPDNSGSKSMNKVNPMVYCCLVWTVLVLYNLFF